MGERPRGRSALLRTARARSEMTAAERSDAGLFAARFAGTARGAVPRGGASLPRRLSSHASSDTTSGSAE